MSKRLDSAQLLMLDGNLEPSEYKLVRSKLAPEKAGLEAKINALGTKKDNDAEAIDFGFYFLTNLHGLFTSADLSLKRRIIGSTFPAKMIFENGRLRTAFGDDIVTLITAVGADLKQNRKGNQKKFDDPSCSVDSTDNFSNRMMDFVRSVLPLKSELDMPINHQIY